MTRYFVDATLTIKVSDLLVETDDHYSTTFEQEIKKAIENALDGKISVGRGNVGSIESVKTETLDNWNSW